MMDDILVVGKNREEHDKRLWEVLLKIEKAGMTLNKSKCEFGVKEVKFLGHILSTKGISVDPARCHTLGAALLQNQGNGE